MSYLEMLAANNRQRFVFARFPDILKHATKWSEGRRGGKRYKERQVRLALRLLEKLTIISPALRKLTGREYDGWTVRTHTALGLDRRFCIVPFPAISYRSLKGKKAKAEPPQIQSAPKFPQGMLPVKNRLLPPLLSDSKGLLPVKAVNVAAKVAGSKKAKLSHFQSLSGDDDRVLDRVSNGRTLSNTIEQPFFHSEKRMKKGSEQVACSDTAAFSLPKNLKAEGPERAKAKAFFKVRKIPHSLVRRAETIENAGRQARKDGMVVLAGELMEICAALKALGARVRKGAIGDLEVTERNLTVLEEKLNASLLRATPAEVVAQLRAEVARSVIPYRRKMPPREVDLLERRSLKNLLFERYKIPHLSFLYL